MISHLPIFKSRTAVAIDHRRIAESRPLLERSQGLPPAPSTAWTWTADHAGSLGQIQHRAGTKHTNDLAHPERFVGQVNCATPTATPASRSSTCPRSSKDGRVWDRRPAE
jgi:hypothetical protein